MPSAKREKSRVYQFMIGLYVLDVIGLEGSSFAVIRFYVLDVIGLEGSSFALIGFNALCKLYKSITKLNFQMIMVYWQFL